MGTPYDSEEFVMRHVGPDEAEISSMLKAIGVDSLTALIEETIPEGIRLKDPLRLPAPKTESEFLSEFRMMATRNKLYRSFIGQGYYGTITPPVILRNVFQNPGWYTAYTPYQAEIAQGRLEALVNFQTMIMDLTSMPLANASLLDEATAAAEGMHLTYTARHSSKRDARKFVVGRNTYGQTIDVIRTRCSPLGIDLTISDLHDINLSDASLFGILVQYPDSSGSLVDLTALIERAHENDVLVVVSTDLLALVLAKPPGEMGADVVIGSSQRFGVPMGYGGPHAAFFATREEFKRLIPGRIIGVSRDADGNHAYRMALQTREQHIRREKATSNICTAQVLLAVMAGMYAVYHGAERLTRIASRVHSLARQLETTLRSLGIEQLNEHYFDTLRVRVDRRVLEPIALKHAANFFYFDDTSAGISLDETTTAADLDLIENIFSEALGKKPGSAKPQGAWPDTLARTSPFLTHPIFNTHHSELEMMRYLKRLENKDLSMVHSMIPLGSCTMKLNAAAEMIPVSWPELSDLHPFVPEDQADGYHEMISKLEAWLCTLTGFEAVSLQPNSGAQGEFAGLMVIRAHHLDHGDAARKVALIPSSAHGTNPASASMAGMDVVVVRADEQGKIDLADLKAKANQNKETLACLMVTYPSTHGVFEENIRDICDAIHQAGGLVYMDGANMNAQVGLTSPAAIGADVCHLNLHKTFCIPHGGGGPGMGPICVTRPLEKYLPGHFLNGDSSQAISSAPFGSANILAISYAYIALMGGAGLTHATRIAILNANYMKTRLEGHYKILYAGMHGRCAHEMIVDCREFKRWGIEVEDIAKRLMDYGFHAPTVSFPVPGTLMIEPTESETKTELDRFCDAMVAIRSEIEEIEQAHAEKDNNVLTHAPHTAATVISDKWNRPYSREQAAYPLPFVRENKFWPAVSRIDNAYGDRNLFCSCPVLSAEDNEEAAYSGTVQSEK